MNKWTQEQIHDAQNNDTRLCDCPERMQEMFAECGRSSSGCLCTASGESEWSKNWQGREPQFIYRIPQNWPPAAQIIATKPPQPFATVYTYNDEQYEREDDEIALEGKLAERSQLNDEIKTIRKRIKAFDKYVTKSKEYNNAM